MKTCTQHFSIKQHTTKASLKKSVLSVVVASLITGGLVACSQETGLADQNTASDDVKPIIIEQAKTPETQPVEYTVLKAPIQEDKRVAIKMDSDLLFAFDSSALGENEQIQLQKIAKQMKQADSGTVWQLIGHTDMAGSEAYNEALAQRRADSVKNYLISEGVDETQLSAISLGKSEPLIPAVESYLERRVVIQNYEAEELNLAVKLHDDVEDKYGKF